ncbi:hypothetical protein BDV26DRAFT_302777 [Aspergillus bertholletiae]|uniref:MADS-box domain-containing protein n=1 Tax=Aspergillus bertholletiae TaxID=1226010 RepID=A0A5N7ANJ9_9EURO|nr:hypothetical protein BDV26DRAFT_302777 [Aspergillus bertholletiae]
MAPGKRKIQRRRSSSARSRCQQRNRRKNNLLLKAFEFCQECDANVSLMIRLRHNGQIVIFNSDDRWHPSAEQLSNRLQDTYYPVPKYVTWEELAARYAS